MSSVKRICLCFLFYLLLIGCEDSKKPSMQDSSPSEQAAVRANTKIANTTANTINDPLVIIYSANLQGELEPCGCTSETDFGGILRRASTLEKLKTKYPDSILVSGGGLLDLEGDTQRIKNDFILKAIDGLGYDAVNLQWRDLTLGEDFLTQYAIPWFSSNHHGGGFNQAIELERGPYELAFYGLLDPSQAPLDKYKSLLLEKQQTLLKKLESVDSAVLQVAFVDRSYADLQAATADSMFAGLDDLAGLDVLIAPSGVPEFAEPTFVDGLLVLGPGHRGMRLGVIELTYSAENQNGGPKLQVVSNQVIELDKQVVDSQTWLPWYDEYNEAVRLDFEREVAIQKERRSGEGPYVGADACKGCHLEAYEAWQQSVHAKALDILKAKGKAFDPECVQCHVVGLGEDGGYLSELLTPELAHVQCESCHGPRRDHVKNPVAADKQDADVKEHSKSKGAVCLTCHNEKHSPSFDFETYWPQIEHK